LLLVALTSASSASPKPAPQIAALRHFSSIVHTRLVLELSEPGRPAVQVLPAGAARGVRRIYLDLPGFSLAAGVPRSLSLPEGPIAEVRVGRGEEDTLRIVVVIRESEGYEAFGLSGPPRLVLDVRAPRSEESSYAASAESSPTASKPPGAGAAPQDARSAATAAGAPATSAGEKHARRAPAAARSRAARGAVARSGPGAARPRPSGASRPLKVVLDPGHGGKDPGAHGEGGLLEKDVVLDIARQLAGRLKEETGASVVLTRERDVFLTLEERTARANAEGADLFVSIHANASAREDLAGVETYYLNNTDDRATVRLAAMENGLKFIGNGRHAGADDLSYILSDLVQAGKLQDSVALSHALQRGLVSRLRDSHPDVGDLGVKQGPFYVLVGAYMPCVLVEVSFLTNPVEGRRLGTKAYREAIAEGLSAGMKEYIATVRQAHTL
jgi:N-acetylmuramoyl-L-alanine amidase